LILEEARQEHFDMGVQGESVRRGDPTRRLTRFARGRDFMSESVDDQTTQYSYNIIRAAASYCKPNLGARNG